MTLSSCDSWLDVNPSDKYSVETFWKTQEHAKAGLMGCYNVLLLGINYIQLSLIC